LRLDVGNQGRDQQAQDNRQEKYSHNIFRVHTLVLCKIVRFQFEDAK